MEIAFFEFHHFIFKSQGETPKEIKEFFCYYAKTSHSLKLNYRI
jgi:hypothetical protein